MNQAPISHLEQVYKNHKDKMNWEDELLCRHGINQLKLNRIKSTTINDIWRILYKYADYEEINNLNQS